MISRRILFVVAGMAWLSWCCLSASRAGETESTPKAEAKPEVRYLRVARDAKGRPTALEAAVARFRPAEGKTGPAVDLVSAVHVADASFYDRLNKAFRHYDAVLYELVAPKDAKPPKDAAGASGNPVSAIQTGMTQLLELEFQLEGVDYDRDNFVHADLSPEEFSRSMQERDESVLSIMLRMMGYALAQQGASSGKTSDGDLLLALLDKNRAMALKRIMAEQFEQLGGMTAVLDGPKGSTLISERNKRAMEVLREEIAAGKKTIAIFYGAGHMPDMENALKTTSVLSATTPDGSRPGT